ncbi:hypothetical protein ACJ41O_012206 [Fusarium nematophilum]
MKTVPVEGDGLATFVLTIIMLVVCWPTVIVRFIIRMNKAALGLDDWLMGVGLLMTTAWSGVLISYCFSGGGYDPNDPRISPDLLSQALRLYFVCQSVYCPTTIPIKISICVALLRICGTVSIYKWALYAIIGISTVAGLGSMTGIVASCSPPSAFWDPSTGTCNPLVNTFAAYFISACSILTDFALAILPAFILWKVQLRRSIKVSVAIILGLAAVASTATIVRLRYLLALLHNQNFLSESGKIAAWTVVELGIGIFAGSVPALRPLLRYIPFLSYHETQESGQARNKSGSHVKMDSFKPGTFSESVRNPKGANVLEDGDSQEYILESQGGRQKMGSGIRKDISVKVERSLSTGEWDAARQYYR